MAISVAADISLARLSPPGYRSEIRFGGLRNRDALAAEIRERVFSAAHFEERPSGRRGRHRVERHIVLGSYRLDAAEAQDRVPGHGEGAGVFDMNAFFQAIPIVRRAEPLHD